MKKLLAIAILSMFALTHTARAQEKCLSELKFREDAKSNPQLLINRENLDKQIQQFIASGKMRSHKASRTPGPATYIIPVVVHVMHYGGPENISKEQVQDQIRSIIKPRSAVGDLHGAPRRREGRIAHHRGAHGRRRQARLQPLAIDATQPVGGVIDKCRFVERDI